MSLPLFILASGLFVLAMNGAVLVLSWRLRNRMLREQDEHYRSVRKALADMQALEQRRG